MHGDPPSSVSGSGREPEPRATPPADRPHFVLLDAGRGIAAIVVLILHLGNEAGLHVVPRGYLAVDFFLMLSGFVIARAYEAKLAAGMGLGAFLGIRAARLWPVVFMGGVLASIGMWTWPIPDWPPGWWLVWQFALIPSATWLLFPANAPMWSLFYETIANIGHAVVLRRVPASWLAAGAAALAAVMIGYAARTGEYDMGFRPGEQWPALGRVLTGYVMGIVLWRAIAAGRLRGRACHWSVPAALILVPLFVPKAVPEGMAVAIGLAGFALAILASLGPGPRGRRTLAAATWLGGISYPLYAVHMPVMKIGFAFWRPDAPGWARAAGWAALGLAGLIVATLVERWWDAPIRTRLRAWRIKAWRRRSS